MEEGAPSLQNEGEYDTQVHLVTNKARKKTPEALYQSRYMRWYRDCQKQQTQQLRISPSRLQVIMIKKEEERIRRLTEGESEDEEDPLQNLKLPTIGDLSLILQPNSSNLQLKKQVAIMNEFMLRQQGLKKSPYKQKLLTEVKPIQQNNSIIFDDHRPTIFDNQIEYRAQRLNNQSVVESKRKIARQESDQKLNKSPHGVLCRSCHSKKKLKNNFRKALQFKFEQMAKKMRQEKEQSHRSNDSFETVDFNVRNKKQYDVKELQSSQSLFNYLKSNQHFSVQRQSVQVSRNTSNLLNKTEINNDCNPYQSSHNLNENVRTSQVLPKINPRYWKQYETFDRAMADSKVKYTNNGKSPLPKNSPIKIELPKKEKQKDKINLEKMIRKPSKFFFQDLNTLLYRQKNIEVEKSDVLKRYGKDLEIRKNPLL